MLPKIMPHTSMALIKYIVSVITCVHVFMAMAYVWHYSWQHGSSPLTSMHTHVQTTLIKYKNKEITISSLELKVGDRNQ